MSTDFLMLLVLKMNTCTLLLEVLCKLGGEVFEVGVGRKVQTNVGDKLDGSGKRAHRELEAVTNARGNCAGGGSKEIALSDAIYVCLVD